MILYIDGEIPSKKNANKFNTKTRCVYKNKRYKVWYDYAVMQVTAQKAGQPPVKQPVKVSLKFVHGDFVKRDSDNGVSSIFDLLKDCGIVSDDNWKVIPKYEVENYYEKGKPCCRVEIVAL